MISLNISKLLLQFFIVPSIHGRVPFFTLSLEQCSKSFQDLYSSGLKINSLIDADIHASSSASFLHLLIKIEESIGSEVESFSSSVK